MSRSGRDDDGRDASRHVGQAAESQLLVRCLIFCHLLVNEFLPMMIPTHASQYSDFPTVMMIDELMRKQ